MKLIVLMISMLLLCSCTTLSEAVKELAGTKKAPSPIEKPTTPVDAYSNTKNHEVYPLPERQYGRMNRATFEQEAKVDSDAGSLWVDEGQGSYLFSQNQRRLEGDVLNVNLEEQALEQLNSKVNVIADLLKQKEELQKRQVASAEGTPKDGAAPTIAAAPAPAAAPKKEEVNVKQVPTRVVTTYPDGSYRVRGTKNIMIGNREFQVLVSGLVRNSDIADDAVASGKMLDSKFDIITNRKVQ